MVSEELRKHMLPEARHVFDAEIDDVFLLVFSISLGQYGHFFAPGESNRDAIEQGLANTTFG